MFTLRILDADRAGDHPLSGVRVRVVALDDNGKDVLPPLVDRFSDRRGRVSFDVVTRRLAGGRTAPLPRVRVTVSGLDGTELLNKALTLDRDTSTLTERVSPKAHEERLRGPLVEWQRTVGPAFSPELTAVLQRRKIASLADLRAAENLSGERTLSAQDRAQIAVLEAHAQLQVLSRDHRVNQALVDAGFRDLLAVADARRAVFLKAVAPTIDTKAATRLHSLAREKAALLANLLTTQRVEHANGRPAASLAAAAPPCACDCQSAVSPLAYLTDLLDYASRHVTFEDRPVSLSHLESDFGQRFSDLPTDCAASTILVRQVRLCVEVLLAKRPASTELAVASAHAPYLLEAYDQIVRELGTSVRELRLARGGAPEDVASLAGRLGIAGTGDIAARLSRLRLVAGGAGERALTTQSLERLFGLQDTHRDPLSTGAVLGDGGSQIVRWRVQGIAWGRNTDVDGLLHVSLVKAGSQHELRLYRDARRRAEDLVATSRSADRSAELILTAEGESGLSGSVEIAYRSNDTDMAFSAVPQMLSWRLATLRDAWLVLDAAAIGPPAFPIIDPDMLPDSWVVPSEQGDAVFGLLESRRASLDVRLARVAAINTAAELDAVLTRTDLADGAGAILVHRFGFADTAEIDALDRAMGAGARLPVDPDARGLLMAEMTALLETRRLDRLGATDASDWAAVHHILVQAEKRRHLFAVWRGEEAAAGISLSPAFFAIPAGSMPLATAHPSPTGGDAAAHLRRQWRVDPQRARAWERALAERVEQEAVAIEGVRRAVDAAEEATLPGLRERLLAAVVPSLAPAAGTTLRAQQDWVTNRLLVHAAEGACRKTTRVAQAVETLQRLIHGLYTGLFEGPGYAIEHALDLGESGYVDLFPGAWRWLGSYATWRAAMFVFLYPENLLLPTYRSQQSPMFRAFVEVLNRPFDLAGDEDAAGADDGPPDPVEELAAELREYSLVDAGLRIQRPKALLRRRPHRSHP